MDAQAYLMRHGWSGPGNPLNANQRPGPHGGLGLTKPILVARKQNNHGVGKKTTKDATNQWWLRGFEDALNAFEDENPAGSTESGNALTSELYRFFVRGQGLAGTLGPKIVETSDKSTSKAKRKRDSEDEDERRARKEGKAARKEEKAARKEEKAARKEEKSKRRKLQGDEDVAELSAVSLSEKEQRRESKAERRARRKEKTEKKEICGSGDSSVDDDLSKSLKKPKKSTRSTSEEDYPTPMSTEQEMDQGHTDTADDAAEQAKAKKEKKESKKSKKKDSEDREVDSKKKSKKDKKEKKSSSA